MNKIPINFIGISSCEKDYRVSLEINKHLGINLKQDNKNLTNHFNDDVVSIFSYFDEENEVLFLQISNKTDAGLISSRYKNIDYFFIVSPNYSKNIDQIKTLLKSGKIITGSYTLKTDSKLKKVLKKYFNETI